MSSSSLPLPRLLSATVSSGELIKLRWNNTGTSARLCFRERERGVLTLKALIKSLFLASGTTLTTSKQYSPPSSLSSSYHHSSLEGIHWSGGGGGGGRTSSLPEKGGRTLKKRRKEGQKRKVEEASAERESKMMQQRRKYLRCKVQGVSLCCRNKEMRSMNSRRRRRKTGEPGVRAEQRTLDSLRMLTDLLTTPHPPSSQTVPREAATARSER
jgi:hypothetical protein